MKINNTCERDACLNMSALDLKIFLHYSATFPSKNPVNGHD